MSDTAVAAFARQLFTNRQQLARELPTASQIEKPDTDKDAALPAHAGAAAYIDGNERTFLEKYTDYIWVAILIVFGLGSVGAWLKHYWNKDEREVYVGHRDELLDLISRVRKAETPEELADMQNTADGILRHALDCYDDGAVEDGDLSVIGFALEQFHHAVADRRAVLGTGAADSHGCAPARPPYRFGWLFLRSSRLSARKQRRSPYFPGRGDRNAVRKRYHIINGLHLSQMQVPK